MGKKAKKSCLAGIPAWAWSLMILFVLIILLVILEDPKNDGYYSTIQIIGYAFCAILITAACFFICRKYPKSVWSTSAICNAVSILGIIMYIFTDWAPLSETIVWVGIYVLSVIGAIVGARIGQRRINQEK